MQDQQLTEIKFKAGIIREPVGSAAEGYWVDADKIRFRFGKPELMGGWQNVTSQEQTANLWGTPRLVETIRSLIGERSTIIGTDVGLFASNLSKYENVTPVVASISATNILSATDGLSTVVVSVSNHGLTPGTIIGFTSADTTLGGTITVNVSASVTALYQVTSIVDANSFEFDVLTTATETSAESGGDFSLIIYYPAGRTSDVLAGGWGGGVWNGNFGWGSPTGSSVLLRGRQWSMDNWGTELMAVPSRGPIMLYQPQNGIFNAFTIVTAAPSVNQILRVATESRHVILYGTHDIGGLFDPLLIRWSSQEDYEDWLPTDTNTAGDFRLNSSGSEIVSVVKVRDQHLILTDSDAFTQAYIGPNDVFGFSRAGEKCGAMGQNAATEHGGVAYWMSNNNKFCRFDGRVQDLPCDVLRFVFDNIDLRYNNKVFAGTNSQYNELIWLYTSKDSPDGENDRYVIFNLLENSWNIGTLARTAWKDRTTYDDIIASGAEGEGLFYHEIGIAADTSVLRAHVESAYFDEGDGDAILFVNKFVADMRDTQNNQTPTNVRVYLKTRKYPGNEIITKGPYLVNGFTGKTSTRLRGRQVAVRIESDTLSSQVTDKWRMNQFSMAMQGDGKR